MNNNAIQKKPRFSVAIQSDGYQKLIHKTLTDPEKAKRFIASISSAVATNPDLQDCDAGTILSVGLLGESLNLSPSPQLGQYYIVPFNDRKNGRKVATFQIGYKGYQQLAIRSGQVKRLIVMPIKQGELISYNPFEETIKLDYNDNEAERNTLPTIGYYAMFELLNGYRKVLYWSREKMYNHAMTYSQGFQVQKGYTFWEKDFDAMGCKTMLRQLISKGGCPMSTEMQTAYERDTATINTDGSYTYIDTPESTPEPLPSDIPDAPPAEVSIDDL